MIAVDGDGGGDTEKLVKSNHFNNNTAYFTVTSHKILLSTKPNELSVMVVAGSPHRSEVTKGNNNNNIRCFTVDSFFLCDCGFQTEM